MKYKVYIIIIFLMNMIYANGQVLISVKPIYKPDSLSSKSSISVLKFYMSDFHIYYKDGSAYQEMDGFHLLDIDAPESFTITLKASSKEIDRLTFNIGIDSATNVSGALGGDLDPLKGMYWAWQSGYINFKLEGTSDECLNPKKEYTFHIGGYLRPFYALRKVEIPITHYRGSGVDITMDIEELLTRIDLTKMNSVMIPCREAMLIADEFPRMFSNK